MSASRPVPPRFRLLETSLTGIRPEEAVGRILDAAKSTEKNYVCVFAVDSILRCHDNPRLAAVANSSMMTLCDGMPLVLVGRHAAHLDMARCYGPDTMLSVLDKGRERGLRHYFYGGANAETSRRLCSNMRSRFPGLEIAGAEVPPFRPLTPDEREETAARINAAKPDVIWVGLGTPKQDFFMADMRPLLQAPIMVAVGAAFAFHAGMVPQAPHWMQRSCLEWLYRLCAEPKRLWRRYILGNPRFVFLLLRQWITARPAPLGEIVAARQ